MKHSTQMMYLLGATWLINLVVYLITNESDFYIFACVSLVGAIVISALKE